MRTRTLRRRKNLLLRLRGTFLFAPGCVDLGPGWMSGDAAAGVVAVADAGADATMGAGAADAGSLVEDASIDGGANDAGAIGALSDAGPDGGTDAGQTQACLPFDPPSLDTLRASPRKVFAHYFAPFPISIDNLPSASDYYSTQYLAADGELGQWQFCGGYLRDRPTPRSVSGSASWFDDTYDLEIRRARDIGIDGFTFDILATSGPMWERLDKMLSAAERTDPGFRIALMPDMYATFQGADAAASAAFVDAMASVVAAHPNSLFRLADQRVVIAPYGAEQRSGAWWKSAIDGLAARGIAAAFIPLFSNVPFETAMTSLAQSVPLAGVASWGARTPGGAPALQRAPQTAHAANLLWMAPVAPQDVRPKDLVYWESQNSLTFRLSWAAAIAGGADWVQLITWNDYSESTGVSPSERTGFAFADLSAYYTIWFKTGAEPPIVRDRLYYAYRSHALTAKPNIRLQTGGPFRAMDDTPSTDEVELIAMLTAPGTLEIQLGGTTTQRNAPAGLSVLRAPLAEGTPTFRVLRGGLPTLSVTGTTAISNTIDYQDPLYHAGSSARCADTP